MTGERSYRINRDYHDPTKFRFVDNAIAEGLLVPDDRLQTIADAWNGVVPSDKKMLRNNWRMLAPVIDLLNALVNEEYCR